MQSALQGPRAFRHLCLASAAILLGSLGAARAAHAAGQGQAAARPMFVEAGGGGGGYKGYTMSMPVTFSRETIGHFEMNLGGHAAIAIEGGILRKGQDLSQKDVEDTGESIETKGMEVAVYFARYSEGANMSGFYWALGAGYRQVDAAWDVRPQRSDTQIDFSLLDDPDAPLHHSAKLSGSTGHARVGYRFVGDEYPVTIGAYIGLRHFQSGVKDAEVKPTNGDTTTYAVMTDREKERLQRRYTTQPEPAIEIGFAF